MALTWVHSSTGVKLPVRQIADALPDRVLLCVDGVHGLAAEADTVRSLRCDAFASGCHKWLYGPRGTGVLWAGPRVRALARPTIPSFEDGESYGAWLAGGAPSGVPDGARLTPGGFHSFEHRWALDRGLRVPRGDRARARRDADSHARLTAAGGLGRGARRHAPNPISTRAVGGSRLLRRRGA